MSATSDLSIILNASSVVQCVIALLLFLSILSWTTIFQKAWTFSKVNRQTKDFESRFWSGTDLNNLLRQGLQKNKNTGPLERIFMSGLSEFLKGIKIANAENQMAVNRSRCLDAAHRAMKASCQRELDRLEFKLPFLASIGSVSPYIGLLATVWGIMHSFRGLANMQQTTLANVAPGISEALIATAIGLFTAIPAVVAYNKYTATIDRLSSRCESFMEEFLNILQKQQH